MENLLMEIEKSMHQGRSLSVLNNGGFGYNSFQNYYSLNPSFNSRGSVPIISPPDQFYSSFFPPNHRHQPPLLPLPTKPSTFPPTNKKRKKKKKHQQQKQLQLKPDQSVIIIPKPEVKADVIEKMVKKEEEEDTEEVFLIVGSLSKTAIMPAYTSISPPPPSSVPMPRLLLKPKMNNVGSDDLRRLLHL